MSELMIWAVVLIAAAAALFFVELFVPSGGLIGVAAALCLVVGIVLLFIENQTAGLVTAIVCLVALPFGFALGIKLWPETPIGRLLSLQEAQRPLTLTGANQETGQASPADELVGASGVALTDLRPVGTCLINGQRVECLADGGVITAGTQIKVVLVDGIETKVRPAEEA